MHGFPGELFILHQSSMGSKKTLLNDTWLREAQFSSCIARSSCSNKAHCKICGVSFDLGNIATTSSYSRKKTPVKGCIEIWIQKGRDWVT